MYKFSIEIIKILKIWSQWIFRVYLFLELNLNRTTIGYIGNWNILTKHSATSGCVYVCMYVHVTKTWYLVNTRILCNQNCESWTKRQISLILTFLLKLKSKSNLSARIHPSCFCRHWYLGCRSDARLSSLSVPKTRTFIKEFRTFLGKYWRI